MKLIGAGGQQVMHRMYDASGTIVSGTAPQLLLPRAFARSHLVVMNLSPTYPMYLEIGGARAVATISNGSLSAITVTNPGFGFSFPPMVQIRGGGAQEFPGFIGATDPLSPSAKGGAAHCVMSGTAPNMTVASITIDSPGSGFLLPPYIEIANRHIDPNGCADPSYGGGSGILLPVSGGSYVINGTCCPTDTLALYASGGAGAKFTCKWMD